MLAAVISATAQGLPGFDGQIAAARAALGAGDPDKALSLGDAAVRMNPERWDGFAVAGAALLALRQYEPAADALSKAIERAPEAQQGKLRELRRECLLSESASAASPPADRPAARSAPNPSPPVPAAHPTAPLTPSPTAVAAATEVTRSSHDPGLWLDESTGLMWARPWYYPKGGPVEPWNLGDAQSFCAMLSLGAYSNWRLPTAEELQQVFHESSRRWYWSAPTFDQGYGIDAALEQKQWRPADFVIDGAHFNGTRLFLWTSTPSDKSGEHVGLYFGKRYSVRDEQRMGSTFEGSVGRTPFQGYALCMRAAS
jgi:tetratricopeptide (TPR) repeat protein